MSTKKKLFIYSILPVLGLSLLSVNFASARGGFGGFDNLTQDQIAERQQNMFQREADILGISVDDVKNAWAEGKTIKQLMDEKGIDPAQVQQRVKDAHLQQMKTHLQTLVGKGVITQAQADKRLQAMQSSIQNGAKKGRMGMGMMGFHRKGFRF